MRKLAIPQNTVICCPKCDQFIALVKHDIYHGDPMLAESFEYPQHPYKNGDLAICFKCGKWWYDAEKKQIHTTKGWLPNVEAN